MTSDLPPATMPAAGRHWLAGDDDLPLTAFFRGRAGTITVMIVTLAIAALASFTVPFLLGR